MDIPSQLLAMVGCDEDNSEHCALPLLRERIPDKEHGAFVESKRPLEDIKTLPRLIMSKMLKD